MEPHDDASIKAGDQIIRRINPVHHVVWDDNLGCNRISTKAFSPSSTPNGGMSIDIEKLIVEGGLDPYEYVTTPKFTGSVVFSAGAIRDIGLIVGSNPLDENPYHGEVWNPDAPNKFTKSQKRRLARACDWYVRISNVNIT